MKRSPLLQPLDSPAAGSTVPPHRLRKLIPFIGVATFGVALYVLHGWLHDHSYRDIAAAMSVLPSSRLVLALALTCAGYAALTGYDWLALRYVGRRLPPSTVAATSFIANALSNNFGNTLFTGAAVRYWVYTSTGLSNTEIGKVILFCSACFWLGILLVGGAALAFVPINPAALPLRLHWAPRLLGHVFLIILAACLLLAVLGRHVLLRTGLIKLPSFPMMLGMISVAAADLCLMASVFYALLPATGISFAECLATVLIALVVSNLSLVPGGLGVFESVVALLLRTHFSGAGLAASLLMFRLIYFLVPLLAAVALVAFRPETGVLRRPPGMNRRRLRAVSILAPHALSATSFIAGLLLLYSGALPASATRLAGLGHFLALPLIEASHFAASLVGAALLLLANALQRRIDAAWQLAILLLATGAALSLLKGWNYEEAILLGTACLAMLPLRRQFYRKSSLLRQPFTISWTASIVIALAASAWLAYFAQRHTAYAGMPWWTFALDAQAPRSLRAAVGATGTAILFALYRLLKPAQPTVAPATSMELKRARPIIERSVETYPNLALRGDKALLFSQGGNAFLMYGRHGRSWVTMGDPVGPDNEARELLWQFRDLCDQFDGWCVLFEVSGRHRAQYAEIGLALTPLGEEARVQLAEFDLGSPLYKALRQTRSRLQRQGCSFEILPPEAVCDRLSDLARISTVWLAGKATHEKSFSNASFDAGYLKRFPVAVVKQNEEIVAFANLWQGAGKEELSIDLMRHLPAAPHGTMDLLFCELMLWGKQNGYCCFNLGMAPLSGLMTQAEMPMWRQLGTFIFQHGEHFYNFQGLRQYKAKFHPVWRTLYLASPGGIALPAILVDVAALVAGSKLAIVAKRGLLNQD